jgi:glycerol kinase
MRHSFILAIDQGTSSTKSLIFDDTGQAVAKGSEPLETIYSANGFVEQDPEEIYQNVLSSVKKCVLEFTGKGFDKKDIVAIGISNQRETFIVWDKEGKPLHNAIVWQCKRSVQICEQLKQKIFLKQSDRKQGLLLTPTFLPRS